MKTKSNSSPAIQHLLSVRLAAITLSAAFFLSSVAPAAVLISTLGQAHSGSENFPDGNRFYATDFTTGVSTSTVTMVTAYMRNIDGASVCTVIPEIWSNVAGLPGSVAASFDTPITLLPSAPYGNYSATAAGIALAASTTYWLVFRSAGPSTLGFMGWTSGQDVNGGGVYAPVVGSDFQRSDNAGALWFSIGTGTPLFELQGTADPIPEPSRAALLLGGLIGIILRRRR